MPDNVAIPVNPSQRLADIYLFMWHPGKDESDIDHRDPAQWEFYVVATAALPDTKEITLANVRKRSLLYGFDTLRPAVEAMRRTITRAARGGRPIPERLELRERQNYNPAILEGGGDGEKSRSVSMPGSAGYSRDADRRRGSPHGAPLV